MFSNLLPYLTRNLFAFSVNHVKLFVFITSFLVLLIDTLVYYINKTLVDNGLNVYSNFPALVGGPGRIEFSTDCHISAKNELISTDDTLDVPGTRDSTSYEGS